MKQPNNPKTSKMPRVTEVLDRFPEPAVVSWKVRVGAEKAKEISDEALDIGSIVDGLIQQHINGNYKGCPYGPEDYPEVHSCMNAWNNFLTNHPWFIGKVVSIQDELKLDDLVGHPDIILKDEICDIKCSKAIRKSYWMQTAQYAYMKNMTPTIDDGKRFAIDKTIKRISILRLDKATGEYEYKFLEEPFITFWQSKFDARYQAFKEDAEFHAMMRKHKEKELLA